MLACKNLTYKIGDKTLVNNVSLSFEKGKFYSILGPNGAGKSTLLKLLTQEITKYEGKIDWQNDPIDTYSSKYWSQQRGILNQWNAISMGFTNNEIVLMGRYPYFKNSPSEEDINVVADQMKKTQTLHLGKRFYDQLSGGEKQRIHLARVLSQVTNNSDEPIILILDEPLNNLDIKHQQNILRVAQILTEQGNIVIAVLHDLNLAAAFSDEIILMQNGGVKAHGSAEEVYQEDLLSACYDVKVHIHNHPVTQKPIVLIDTSDHHQNENINTKKEVLWK